MSDLEQLERVLADALCAREPWTALQHVAADPTTPAVLRKLLAHVDEDGFRISALLVARLRFERLVHGSREAFTWFDDDPRAFTAAFKLYHASVPPTACFPREEAQLFARWRAETSAVGDGSPSL